MSTMGVSAPSERVMLKSLPPAARRKLFSNAEYLRLAQGGCCHGLDHQSNLAKLRYREFQFLWDWSYLPASDKSIHKKEPLKRVFYPGTSRNLHHASMPQVAFLAACPDWQCFNSLPPKIQQSCFSDEERNRLRQICYADEVFDAADEALFRLGKRRRMSESVETSSLSQSSTLCFGTSDVDIYDDMDDMDRTRSGCTGRLDEDEQLDLAIDEYHAHVLESPSRISTRRSLSFSRILPVYPSKSGFRPLSTVHSSPNPSQSSAASEADMTTPTLDSGSYFSQSQFHHTSRSSTSSIDPSAQYYQDPEARLKLRVYLASPQKFDEAVEFGFPTLKREGRGFTPPKIQNPDDGTFFEEGTAFSSVESRKGQNSPRASGSTRYSQSLRKFSSLNNNRRQWLPSSDTNDRRSPGNREMTLKMTLTRPDLRTDSPTPESTEISPYSFEPPIWESGMSERGLVKKVWRTLRRRKC